MAIWIGGPTAVVQGPLELVLAVASGLVAGLVLRDVFTAWQKPGK